MPVKVLVVTTLAFATSGCSVRDDGRGAEKIVAVVDPGSCCLCEERRKIEPLKSAVSVCAVAPY